MRVNTIGRHRLMCLGLFGKIKHEIKLLYIKLKEILECPCSCFMMFIITYTCREKNPHYAIEMFGVKRKALITFLFVGYGFLLRNR